MGNEIFSPEEVATTSVEIFSPEEVATTSIFDSEFISNLGKAGLTAFVVAFVGGVVQLGFNSYSNKQATIQQPGFTPQEVQELKAMIAYFKQMSSQEN